VNPSILSRPVGAVTRTGRCGSSSIFAPSPSPSLDSPLFTWESERLFSFFPCDLYEIFALIYLLPRLIPRDRSHPFGPFVFFFPRMDLLLRWIHQFNYALQQAASAGCFRSLHPPGAGPRKLLLQPAEFPLLEVLLAPPGDADGLQAPCCHFNFALQFPAHTCFFFSLPL